MAARARIVRALKEIDVGRRVRIVRITALDTPHAYRDLVEVIDDNKDPARARKNVEEIRRGACDVGRGERALALHHDRGW